MGLIGALDGPRGRALVVLAGLLAALYGCDQTSSPVEKQEKGGGVEKAQDRPQSQEEADLPDFEVTYTEDCSGVSWDFPAKCFSITTNARHEEALTRLTDFIRDENPRYDAVLISYYPDSESSASSGSSSGSADVSAEGWAFRNETVANAVLGELWRSPQEPRLDEQVRQAMRNDGIAVFWSVEDERRWTQEVLQDVCAEWDASAAGTPPPFNCPGY